MFSQLIGYIQEHVNSWPLGTKINGKLVPIFRFNKEANGIVEKEQIGTVHFWFNQSQPTPVLVSKIMDASLSVEYIRHWAEYQKEINKKIGRSVFPAIYDVVKIGSRPVIFQEAINEPNYDMQLSKAIFGVGANISTMNEVVKSHLKEMAFLFKHLKTIDVSKESRQWGEWAYAVGKTFKNNYGLASNVLFDGSLDRMKETLNSMTLQRNYVLVDHYSANYFLGPRAVDQIDKSLIKRMKEEPGIIDAFRFIIAYLKTSPLNIIYQDWLAVLALSFTQDYRRIAIGSALRAFWQEVGVCLDRPAYIWSLVMVSFFLRAIDEFTFHKNNPFVMPQLSREFAKLAVQLVEMQDVIEYGRIYDFSSLFRQESDFASINQSIFMHGPFPYLIEEGYKSFNIVLYGSKFHALAQDLGYIDLRVIKEEKLRECHNNNKYGMAASLADVKRLIDESLCESVELIEEDYKGFNIVLYKNKYYMISKNLGQIDFLNIKENEIMDYQKQEKIFIGDSLYEVKYILEQRNYQQLQRELLKIEKNIEVLKKNISLRDDAIAKLSADI